jgi:hypothetical protein
MGDIIQMPGSASEEPRSGSQQRVGRRAACKIRSEQERWAVVADYGGGLELAPGRYETREGVDLAVAVLTAKLGNRNFRAVLVGADESSERVKQRLTSSPTH